MCPKESYTDTKPGVVEFVKVAEPFGARSSPYSASPASSGHDGDQDPPMNTTAAPTSLAVESTWPTSAGENAATASPLSLSAPTSPILVSTSRAQAEPTSRDVPPQPPGHNVQSGLQTPQFTQEDVTVIGAGTPLSAPLGRIYLDPPTWPLQDPEEATLLQHFINQVSLFVSEAARCLAEVQPVYQVTTASSTSVTRNATLQPSCPCAPAHAALS